MTKTPYWLDIPLIEGSSSAPKDGEILIVGSGLAGVSTAYWLLQKGFTDLTLVDYRPSDAASFRNCGHILYGTVESMVAMVALHGEAIAKELWSLSIDICHEVRDTVAREGLDVDYKQDGYLVIAVDESEHQEIHRSIELLNRYAFQSDYVSKKELENMGFRAVLGGRFEAGSAQAHPTKFRNALLDLCMKRGVKYHSNVKVLAMDEENDKISVRTESSGTLHYEAAVIAANAYSPLLSEFFAKHRLVEPFRGQIICSKPLKKPLKVAYPHSFDHGYEYAIGTADNRLMLGGWRNNTPGGEIGTYDITPNPLVEQGLQEFAARHYAIEEKIDWEYSWAGIMAASKTGFPFIGPTDSQRIFTVSGFTGHGFSWAHGSAKYLAKIMAGEAIPDLVARQFNPRTVR